MLIVLLQINQVTEAVVKLGLPVALVAIFACVIAYCGKKFIGWYETKDAAMTALQVSHAATILTIQEAHTTATMKMMDDRRADLDKIAQTMTAHTHAVEANTKIVEKNTETITSLMRDAMKKE